MTSVLRLTWLPSSITAMEGSARPRSVAGLGLTESTLMRAVPVPSPSGATGVDMLISCAVTSVESISAQNADVLRTLRRTDSNTNMNGNRQSMSFAMDSESERVAERRERKKRVRATYTRGAAERSDRRPG